MAIEPPSSSRLKAIASEFGIELSEEEAQVFARLSLALKASYDRLDALAEPRLPVRYARSPGCAPKKEENPYNAWAWLCDLKGASTGLLAGERIGLKDNICVAGMPMRCGNRMMEGFVPDIDATVVTRILDAGGTIAGKTVCEDLCFSGGSHTSQPLAVQNPRKAGHSAGGSSSGSAAAIAAGDVRMCLGGDQGGSIRTPASWCGVVGLKPTHGLVPYTGVFPIELSVDHCGPMGASTEAVARLLTVIAGPDGLDPRQQGVVVQDYMSSLRQPVKGLRIAVLKEGLDRPESEAATDRKVRSALKGLKAAGAEIEEVSLPWHIDAYHVYTTIVLEGSAEMMLKGNAMGYGWQGYYATGLLDAWARGWRSRPNDLPATAKFVLGFAEYMHRGYHGRYYSKAQNLRRACRDAYDRVLASFDALAMPTNPFPAPPLPNADCSIEESITAALNMEGNTGPFDITGHPAISVPCGVDGDLPVGLMFVGKRFDEVSVLRASVGIESLGDWKQI